MTGSIFLDFTWRHRRHIVWHLFVSSNIAATPLSFESLGTDCRPWIVLLATLASSLVAWRRFLLVPTLLSLPPLAFSLPLGSFIFSPLSYLAPIPWPAWLIKTYQRIYRKPTKWARLFREVASCNEIGAMKFINCGKSCIRWNKTLEWNVGSLRIVARVKILNTKTNKLNGMVS